MSVGKARYYLIKNLIDPEHTSFRDIKRPVNVDRELKR